jgi:outer membrane receptor protein involved in Fe transport
VRLVDIERVEALSGPQGTLYGSSSQSGTLRIVTNKPNPTEFEAFADASLKSMSEGDSSYDFSAMVNIPLAEDKFALRLVGFSATEGGYIDNVLGQTANSENGGRTSVNGTQFNTSAVEDDWNETTISGGRVGAKWFINDDWSATLGIAHQKVDSNAENTYDPTVGDLDVIAFSPDTFDDDWTQFALTLDGKIGDLNFTSATAYFTRDSEYNQDTTAYAAYFGSFCYYATASYNIYCFQPAGVNYAYNDPIGFLVNTAENTTFTQEFRVSFSGEKVDWVGGVFWEDRHEEWDFTTYTTNDGGYRNSQGWANWDTNWNVSPPVTDAWWFSADNTDWTTIAVFGEATFHVSDQLSITAGGRWFDVEQDKIYYVELPAGRITPSGQLLDGTAADDHGCIVADAPCNASDSDNPADDGFNRINSQDDDTAFKLSAQWTLSDDKMIYALFSEGFRAGGVNRNRGAPKLNPTYGADFLTNYEVGLKSQWVDGRLQVNATAFFQSWDDYQVEVVDPSNIPCAVDPTPPCGQPWQKGVLNAGNATSDGLELHVEALPTDRLSLRLNATFLNAEVDSDVAGLDGVGKGSPLPFAPDFKGSLYTQYNWPLSLFGSQEAFVQFQYSYVGESLNQVQALTLADGPAPQMTMEEYDVSSLKFGLTGESWEANLFVNNLGDERGQLYHDVTDFERFFGRQRTSVIRPREIGIRFYKSW